MDTHPTPERLRDYRDGRLGPAGGQQLEDHLDLCPECARAYRDVLRENLAAPPPSARPLALSPALEAVLQGLPQAAPSRRLLPGGPFPVLDGYEILEEVGRGAMGVVYRAVDLARRQIVAVKVISAGEFASSEEIERFHREGAAVANLGADAAGVVRVFDHGVCRGLHYLSMEYVAGGPLSARLPELVHEPRETARIIAEVADAVERLHQQGLLHRDLKPANILLQQSETRNQKSDKEDSNHSDFGCRISDCVPLVTDFGLAKRIGDPTSTATGQLVGTPGFMAPEMIRHSKDATPAADIYSLGATLYACLTGGPPFKAATPFDTLKLVESGYPVSPLRLNHRSPAELQWICLKCLEKAPARRYARAADLAADLRRFLAGDSTDPVKARPPSGPVRAWRLLRSHPRLSLGAGFILLLLLGVAVVAVQQARHEKEQREAAGRAILAESQRAETERQAAHATTVFAARQLSRRGDWGHALEEYDRAIADGEADALRLRVERLAGYFALNAYAKLTDELQALGRLELGELGPQVALTRGALLLCDSDGQGQGRALVREALAERQLLFSPADIAFAEALVADRIGQAIKALGRAVAADPFHYLAGSSLAIALAVAGQREEARRQAHFLHSAFPFSAMPEYTEAICDLLDGDRAALKADLARVAKKVPQESQAKVARLEEFLSTILDLQDLAIRLSAGEDMAHYALDAMQAPVLLLKAKRLGGLPNAEPLGLPIPGVTLLYRRILEIFATYVEVGIPATAGNLRSDALSRLEALNDDSPDAVLLLLAGVIHLRQAVDPVNRGDIPAARKQLEAAADLSTRAATAPCLVPRTTIPYLARGLGVLADVALLKMVRDADRACLRRLRDHLHPLVAEGDRWPRLRQEFIALYVGLTVTPLTPGQCSDWNRTTPEGQTAFTQRKNTLASLARGLLDDWALDEPKHPALAGLRADVTKWMASSGVVGEDAPHGK
jgi:serine/threonine protein kinase